MDTMDERRAQAAWFRRLAAAEKQCADECDERACKSDVAGYHRARSSAFLDAAVAVERRLYKQAHQIDQIKRSTVVRQGGGVK
jgi:hypothetical protein